MGRLTIVKVQLCVAICVAVYLMLIAINIQDGHRTLPLTPQQVRRFLDIRERDMALEEGGKSHSTSHLSEKSISESTEPTIEELDRMITSTPNPSEITTTLDIKTTTPSIFIPDLPDTSPLGKPPDIPKRFLIEEADYCKRRPGLQVIAYVHSAISRVKQRNITRTTWANATAYNVGAIGVNLGVVFMVGRPKDEKEQKIVNEESQKYHDIVQGDYGEHYRLLTYKGLAGLYWISKNCANVPWTLHSDDDTNIDIFLYYHALQELDQEAREKFVCSFMYGPALRSGRWKVRMEEYANKTYPLYCSGGVWFLQTKLIPRLLEASKSVPFLWVDDAYITGLLARKAGIKHHPFQKYFGGPKLHMEKLGHEVAWFVKFTPRLVWWDLIVQYHKNNSMLHPVTLLPHNPK